MGTSVRIAVVAVISMLAGLLSLGTELPGPVGATVATPARFVVYAGYADCPLVRKCYGKKITNPRFPSPWYGAKSFTFVADKSVVDVKDDDDPDTSAIRIDNTGSRALTISKVSVKGCGSSAFDIWGTAPFKYPYKIAPKKTDVFSSTSGNNFDGSEDCSSAPTVTVTVNGVSHSYADDVANAGAGAIVGGAYAADDGDESTPWTKLGGQAVTVAVVPSKLGSASVGKHYLVDMAAENTNGAPTFSVGGSFPPGLKLQSSGENATLSGKPTTKGTYHFKVNVSDTASPKDFGSQSYTLVVK